MHITLATEILLNDKNLFTIFKKFWFSRTCIIIYLCWISWTIDIMISKPISHETNHKFWTFHIKHMSSNQHFLWCHILVRYTINLLNASPSSCIGTQVAKLMGPTRAHLGPVGPRPMGPMLARWTLLSELSFIRMRSCMVGWINGHDGQQPQILLWSMAC